MVKSFEKINNKTDKDTIFDTYAKIIAELDMLIKEVYIIQK